MDELKQAVSKLAMELAARVAENADLQELVVSHALRLASAEEETRALKNELLATAEALEAANKEKQLLRVSHAAISDRLDEFNAASLDESMSQPGSSAREMELEQELELLRPRTELLQEQLEASRTSLTGLEQELELLRPQIGSLREQLEASQTSKANLETDMAYVNDMYREASTSAAALGRENQELTARNIMLEGQARLGVKQANLKWEAEVKTLETEVGHLRGTVALLQERARRTDDQVRKRAGAYPDMLADLEESHGQVEVLRRRVKVLERDVKRLEEREVERERALRLREEDSDDDVFLCLNVVSQENAPRQLCHEQFFSRDVRFPSVSFILICGTDTPVYRNWSITSLVNMWARSTKY